MFVNRLKTKIVSKPLKRFLALMGLWAPDVSTVFAILYKMYSYIFLTFFSAIYTLCMCVPIVMPGLLDDLTYRLYMSLTELALVFKVFNFLWRNKQLQALLKWLHSYDVDNLEQHKIVKEKLNFFIKVSVFYYITANVAICGEEIRSVFRTEPKLAYSGWYPGLDWEHSRRDFYIVTSYQFLGLLVTGNTNLSIDLFFCLIMYMNGTQMQFLGMRMERLGQEINGKRTKNVDKGQHTKRLIEYIKIHQNIMDLSATVEECLAFSFFSQLSMSAVTICSITTEMARVSN